MQSKEVNNHHLMWTKIHYKISEPRRNKYTYSEVSIEQIMKTAYKNTSYGRLFAKFPKQSRFIQKAFGIFEHLTKMNESVSVTEVIRSGCC